MTASNITDDRLYWIWLSLSCGGGCQLSDRLLQAFGDAAGVYAAANDDYNRVKNMSPSVRRRLNDKNLEPARAIAAECEAKHFGILTLQDSTYPSRLQQIQGKPLTLYYRGKLPDFERRLCVAVVGTRHMTTYGARMAEIIGRGMADAGIVNVSGLAAGIDGMAQRSTMYQGGYTIAVLGCGVDVVYPKRHALLLEEVAKNGAVISEYPPGTHPNARTFPARNRIISGLCQATVVVEADIKSGSLITARDAIQQGRVLFAVPGNAGETGSAGTNLLIRNGAHSVTSVDDIVRVLRGQLNGVRRLPKRQYEPVWTRSALDVPYDSNEDMSSMTADREPIPKAHDANRKSDPEIKDNRRAATDPYTLSDNHAKAKAKRGKSLDGEKPAAASDRPQPDASLLSPEESAVLSLIPEDGAPILYDLLCTALVQAGHIFPPLPVLTSLELTGWIEAAPGSTYRRITGR